MSSVCGQTKDVLGSVVLTVLVAGSFGQGVRTPGDFARSLTWTAETKGVLMYLPNRQLQAEDDPRQSGGFATFACGTLHVIAPVQMTVIDPDYHQTPNAYDGLPRKLKVLYLASTFSKSQWQTACEAGIGLGDLSQEQQKIYRSILPSVFNYSSSPVSNLNFQAGRGQAATQTTLNPDEESQVRLKIFKEMTLGVRIGVNGGFSAISGQRWERQKIGDMAFRRIDDASEDKNFAFGVEIRKTMPNQSKPSDLDTKNAAFDAALPLSPTSSVKEICQAVSGLVHRTIVPDVRFANESVATIGASGRCGDVLKGLALCVTGTYRKVGNTYVLTSDQEGIGTKMAKLAFWHWNLKQLADQESEKWKSEISTNPGLKSIGYTSDDPLTPNDAMRKFMDTDINQGSGTMPASQLSPIWLKLLNSKDNHFGESLRTDVAEPWDSVFWCFVAPTDKVLGWESELGDLNEFSHYAERHPAAGPAKEQKKIDLGTLPASALIYQLEDPRSAAKLTQIAKGQGFTELWLQTTDSQCLSAAIKSGKEIGISVKLAVEPFTAVGNLAKTPLDLDILGSTYSQAEKLVQGSGWVESTNEWISSNERPFDFLDESSPSLAIYWKKLSALATRTNLSGTIVLAGHPVGYEPQSDWPEYEPPELGAPLSMGYTPDLREKFLLANSVDPIDLLETRYQFDLMPLDQSISSFGNLNTYAYSKVSEHPPSFRDKWDTLRAEANDGRFQEFESNFKVPLMTEWRRRAHDTSLEWDGIVSPQPEGAPQQTIQEALYNFTLPADAYYLVKIGFPLSDGAGHYQIDHVDERSRKQRTPFAFDLRAIPAEKLEGELSRLFAPPGK